MIRDAEDFTAEDEALNRLSSSSFVYGLKTQIGDQEGLGGKISDKDRTMHRSLSVDNILTHTQALRVYSVGMGLISFGVFATII